MEKLIDNTIKAMRKEHDELTYKMFGECGFGRDEVKPLIKNKVIASTSYKKHLKNGELTEMYFSYKDTLICILFMYRPYEPVIIENNGSYTYTVESKWDYNIVRTREEIENEI